MFLQQMGFALPSNGYEYDLAQFVAEQRHSHSRPATKSLSGWENNFDIN